RRLTGVDLGLAHPLAQRLRVHPQPARDRLHRRPLRVVVVAVLADQSYRPGLGVLVVPDRHRAILPTKEVRIKPGTVHSLAANGGDKNLTTYLQRVLAVS